MADTGIALACDQPRHLCKSDELVPQEEILLVELENEDVLKSLLADGAALKSHGADSDSVVLCTREHTYTCKHVQTTNSLLLCDTSQEAALPAKENVAGHRNAASLMSQLRADQAADAVPPVVVCAESDFVVETTKRVLPVEQLQSCLAEHVFAPGASGGDGDDGCALGLSWPQLQRLVLASDRDIVRALRELEAIAVPHAGAGACWCLLDGKSRGDALEAVLLTCIEHGIAFDALDAATLLRALAASPDDLSRELSDRGAFLAKHVLRVFCSAADGGSGDGDLALPALAAPGNDPVLRALPEGPVLAFDAERVGREFAEHAVLAIAGTTAPLGAVASRAAVLAAWQERMPAMEHWPHAPRAADDAAMDCDGPSTSAAAAAAAADAEAAAAAASLFANSLRGVAIQHPQSRGERLQVVLEGRLPLGAKERFVQLFSVQAQWTADALMPYLQRVHDAGCKNAAELLLRYTRSVRDEPGKPVLHCAR